MSGPTSKTDVPEMTVLAGLVGDWSAAAAAGQAVALGLLQAELQGLADQFAPRSTPCSAEDRCRVEAEVEAAFDNMPV